MAHLAGQFAGILQVEVPDGQRDSLVAALEDLSAHGLQVVVQGSHHDTVDLSMRGAALELTGSDRPGIVAEITRVLVAHQVNVEELTTERVVAPMSGKPIFQASGVIRIPGSADIDSLRSELEKISQDLMVELQFHVADN